PRSAVGSASLDEESDVGTHRFSGIEFAVDGGPNLASTPRARRAILGRRPGQAAQDLWAFGEDQLSAQALEIRDSEMASMWHGAGTFYDPSYSLPVAGRKVTVGHVIAFSAMWHLTGELRALARVRRRPAKDLPAAIREVAVPFTGDLHHLEEQFRQFLGRSVGAVGASARLAGGPVADE
ncbi:MAG: hypothetical protein ACRBI6_23320, partial [Acidimicrobiales bacterium]